MHFLLISVCCSVAVSVLLKIARQKQMDIAQMVTVNYPIAALLTWLVARPALADSSQYLSAWWLFVAFGVMLPTVFIVMGRAVQTAGIVKADTAQRVSLVIPLLAAFLLFGEQISQWTGVGITLVFAALVCLLSRSDIGESRSAPWLLFFVWLGYGTIDVLLKQLSKTTQGATYSILFVSFILAAILMVMYLTYKRVCWSQTSILGGVLLGGLNFANIYTYINAHKALKENPSIVFAGMNIGVITTGTLVGAWLFRERLSRLNVIGVSLAIMAIACLTYARMKGV
ncbi:MAG: EamA/RhaT family transporter [Cardiobacteriaceae bacterium]|nr:EamA/RhaT family transporter [Cardiobacteriaceae bacterium]